jgi:hypothetical protein
VLPELCEGLVGSPLQCVIEVVAPSHGEPSRLAWVRGLSQDVHMDLAASIPELTVWATPVCGSPHVAEMVQHVSEQGGKVDAVQPVTTKPSISSESGVGVVIHLSKTSKK